METKEQMFCNLFHLKREQYKMNKQWLNEIYSLWSKGLLKGSLRVEWREHDMTTRKKTFFEFVKRFALCYNILQFQMGKIKGLLGFGSLKNDTKSGKPRKYDNRLIFCCQKLKQLDVMDGWVMSELYYFFKEVFHDDLKPHYTGTCRWCGNECASRLCLLEKNKFSRVHLCKECALRSKGCFQSFVHNLDFMLVDQFYASYKNSLDGVVGLFTDIWDGFDDNFFLKCYHKLCENQRTRFKYMKKIEKILVNSKMKKTKYQKWHEKQVVKRQQKKLLKKILGEEKEENGQEEIQMVS